MHLTKAMHCVLLQDGSTPGMVQLLPPVSEDSPGVDQQAPLAAAADDQLASGGAAAEWDMGAHHAASGPTDAPAQPVEPAGEAQPAPQPEASIPRRQRGMTQAQLRQQEAWGDLAGVLRGKLALILTATEPSLRNAVCCNVQG